MTDRLTYGATRAQLLANGFTPTSLTSPGAYGPRIADEPAAVFLVSEYGKACGVADANKRNVAVITICVRDKKIRSAIAAVFAKHGLGSSPRRTDTMANDSYVVRLDDAVFSRSSRPFKDELDPAVIVQGLDTDARGERVSAVLRLDGTWTNSTLLETSRSKLPTVNLDALLSEAEAIVGDGEPDYVQPKLSPELEAKIELARKARAALDAELAKRTDQAIWAIVDAAIVNLQQGGWGATPLDHANALVRARSSEARIAHYDEIVAERENAAARRKLRVGG